ncbi:hypothetical protein JOE25_004172 [Serratia sp. PL17]|nr:hypothetical protein [Serratia sp. PL17]
MGIKKALQSLQRFNIQNRFRRRERRQFADGQRNSLN